MRRKPFLAACLAAAIAFLLGSAALADSEIQQKSRPATAKDVPGKWEMVYQRHGKVPAADSLFFARHQRFHFTADGFVQNMASQKPMDPAILAALDKAPRTTRFEFTKPGIMTVVRSPRDRDWIVISVITADLKRSLAPNAPLLKRGDLILAYLTPQRQAYMHRYLRRLP